MMARSLGFAIERGRQRSASLAATATADAPLASAAEEPTDGTDPAGPVADGHRQRPVRRVGHIRGRHDRRERHLIDQRVLLTSTRPPLAGLRCWLADAGARVGRLHLPPGGDQFRSRRAHRLAYVSQREGARERARRSAKSSRCVANVT